ncbi:hypothetical protein CCR75_000752 [Bremia lactucae]|uniref:Myosin motor domain-containing protein n=1 Tax=Bremia lactucae TaxID=4779 RepID=A0A976NY93_BRELC|nr:hypothetical protein CCR75_000752 [Bremia lactucae]
MRSVELNARRIFLKKRVSFVMNVANGIIIFFINYCTERPEPSVILLDLVTTLQKEKEPQLENRRGQKLQRSQSPVLKSAASVEAETLKDQSLLKKTKQALSLLGLNAKQQNELFQVLAGILHLGEARFVVKCDNDEACELDMDSVAYSSILLGLLPEIMAKALTHRTMKAAGEIYLVPLTVEQAQSGRDALAKAIYASIFDWLVAGINASLGAKAQQTTSTIGVLDIFGFESFEHNSFEQLCINYANEKLQQKFTQDVFRSVQEEYEREQITWAHIAYADNSETLGLIESRMGLLALLNEEIVRPRGHEEGFVSKLSSAYCKHKTLIEFPRISKTQFAIHHYAGTVLYDATGFLEKHKDALLTDLSDLMCQSHEPFPQMLFQVRKEMEAAAPKHPLSSLGIRKAGADRTVGMQFKKSLNALMTTINDTNVNYIRCIKPNCRKSASLLEDKMVATQLRCAGVIEAICIARVGYPNRLVHGEFAAQFDLFLTKEQQQQLQNDPKTYGVLCCRDVVEQFHLETPEEYQMGQSKIYLQKGVLETLEYAKAQKLYAYVARIQARWRGMRARVEYCNQRIAVRMIQRRVRVFIARRQFQRARVALALIQRVWRGYVGRCAFCSVRKEYFALEMQRVWRGHQGRQVFRAVLKQTRAVRLQCCVRQYFARKELLQRRMERYNQHERERMARELEMLRQRKRAEEQERQKQLEKERVRLADERRREEARRMKSLRIKSAVVIQTNARGYFARCGLAEMQQFAKDEACRVKEELEQERLRCLQREQEEQELRRLAAANAAREKKRAIEERKRKAMAMRQRREKAVTGIQRIFRGFLTRKDIQTMREAAILVQRVSRGYIARKRVKYLENEMCEKEVKAKEVAALGLPSIQRGRLVRQHCSRIRVESKAQHEDVVVALTMRLNEKDEELQRVCDENARLRDEVAALQKSSRDLQSVVADYENTRSIDKTLMHSLDTPCLELENRRGEYSAACNFFANSGSSRRSTEPDELNSSDNFSETSSNYGEEDCNNWKEDRPTMNSLASSYFNGDRPSTDIAKLLSRSQTRTTRLATAMQQRRQKVSQIVQQRKQPSMLHRKDLNAQRMDQNELQTSVSKPKKWATFSRTKFSKKEKHKPLSPIEF